MLDLRLDLQELCSGGRVVGVQRIVVQTLDDLLSQVMFTDPA